MKIRKAKRLDMEKLVVLMQRADNRTKEWAETRVNKFIANKKKDRAILVAADKNRLVGYVGIKKYEDNKARKFVNLNKYIWITWIAVLPDYRNKEIGSKLLKHSEKYIKIFGKRGILLDCRKEVMPFYLGNGYLAVGKYVNKNKKRYVMNKELK